METKLCTKCGEQLPVSDFGTFVEKRVGKGANRVIGGEPKRYRNAYCKPCARAHVRVYIKQNRERISAQYKAINTRLLNVIHEHYGARCNCCGETEPRFLTIDHVNNDGNIDRLKRKASYQVYKQIIDDGFPDRFQLLCWNCNCGRARNGGVCPHQQPA